MQKYCFHLILIFGVNDFVFPGNVIYHEIMTPSWLEAHASYMSNARTLTSKQLTFNPIPEKQAALLKVPLISSGVIKVSTPLTAEIVVANNISIGKSEYSNIRYVVSDGEKFVGIQTFGKNLYDSYPPCSGVEGVSGATATDLQWTGRSSKPSDSFYPGRFVFTLKLNERWGSCYTAHDGGFTKTVGYSKRLTLSKGLTLEVYKGVNDGDKVGIKSIMVTIIQDDAYNTARKNGSTPNLHNANIMQTYVYSRANVVNAIFAPYFHTCVNIVANAAFTMFATGLL
ncbi:uncharacterized protein [Montipora foliosa]|uniref:uncharacterized protein isoform X2 n=1 Tax=Montipora foliosa TaxID=591990 RepID=UPI0035F101E7